MIDLEQIQVYLYFSLNFTLPYPLSLFLLLSFYLFELSCFSQVPLFSTLVSLRFLVVFLMSFFHIPLASLTIKSTLVENRPSKTLNKDGYPSPLFDVFLIDHI